MREIQPAGLLVAIYPTVWLAGSIDLADESLVATVHER
jgi:hypothetical protein